MHFISRKKRRAPAVIIIALIDVLIVVLIFLIVSTTFKPRQPAVNIALPEAKQSIAAGATENAIVLTITREGTLFWGDRPLTADRLEAELKSAVQTNPETSLAIRADKEAAFGRIVAVMDAAKAANLRSVSAFIVDGASP
jgi:biopolymer transport protein ExbD